MNAQLTPAEGVLLRAGMYQLLALGYAYPNAEQRERFSVLSQELAPWLTPIDPIWEERLLGIRESLLDYEPEEAEAEFNRLFSGAMAVAPYETAYERDIFRKQNSLADMSGFYRAFGFELGSGSRWQPDHVGVQLEYCGILLQRTAHALQEGWEEQSAICVDALRKFLGDHIGRWTDAFASDLGRVAESPFYRNLALLTLEWVALEARSLDVEPDRLSSRHVLAEDAEVPSCGGCTGCGPEGPAEPCPLPPLNQE